jgi:hypothetical protein
MDYLTAFNAQANHITANIIHFVHVKSWGFFPNFFAPNSSLLCKKNCTKGCFTQISSNKNI